MKAFALESLESGPRLLELPIPQVGPKEVLIRVDASSVNGFDVAVAGGRLKGMMEHRFPVVLGKDFAGTVEAVGSEASRFAVGDRVFGVVMKPVLGDGAFAEYVAVPEGFGIARIPAGLDLAGAGALGLAGTAALLAVETIGPATDEAVLISGATGGVGGYAVQLAVARGARVIATARPGEEADFVRGLGAAYAVDYTGDLAAQVRSISPGGVDAVIHLAGDGPLLAELLVPGGRFASTLGVGTEQLGGRRVSASRINATPAPDVLGRLADHVATGRLRIPIRRSYRLEAAPRALADFAAPHAGKLAIAIA